MRTQIQAGLIIAAALLMLWAAGLLTMPKVVVHVLTTGSYDSASLSMFGAALLGLALVTFITALNPRKDLVQALAAALALLALMAAIHLIAGSMARNFATITSLIVSMGVALFLFLVQSPSVARARAEVPRKPAPTTISQPAARKASKKKAVKKAKKKAVKKKAAKKRRR